MENELNGWHKSPDEIVHILNDIFFQHEIKVGGLAVGELKEDGLPVTCLDVFEGHKAQAIADRSEAFSNISDLGHLMNLIDRTDHGRLPRDERTRAIDLWKARESMLVAPGSEG